MRKQKQVAPEAPPPLLRITVEEGELRRAGADFILNNCPDVGFAHNSEELTLILNGVRVEN